MFILIAPLLQTLTSPILLRLLNPLHKPLQCCCHPLLGLPSLHHLRDKSLDETHHLNVEWVVPLHLEVYLGLLWSPNDCHQLCPLLLKRPRSLCLLSANPLWRQGPQSSECTSDLLLPTWLAGLAYRCFWVKSKKKKNNIGLTPAPLVPLALDTLSQAVGTDALLWCLPFSVPCDPTWHHFGLRCPLSLHFLSDSCSNFALR